MSPTDPFNSLKRLGLAFALVFASGCSSLDLGQMNPWPFGHSSHEIPTRMSVVWSDAVMNQPGLPGVRGIGGRIHFYVANEKTPAEVSGALSVYAYDDSENADANTVPVRKFVFRPEQLAKRHSVSKLGHSYNVWLPFDEVGSPTRQLTLIARFEPEGGASVMADPARQLLPGVSSPTNVSKSTIEVAVHHADEGPPAVMPAQHQSAASEEQLDAKDRDALDTFTIDLPADVARRWRDQINQSLEQRRSSLLPPTTAEPAIAVPQTSVAE